MLTLFDNPESGYRLHSFEFYNWGCFDKSIWKIEPDGKTSLLTGANGSGKTTVVDALVTLLVPPSRRYYNQSSGADRKRERTEESYLRGAYGSVRGDESTFATTQYLREKKVNSCLLGIFTNSGYKKTIALGQIRNYANGNLKRLYFIGETQLSIKKDIIEELGKEDYKKILKEKHKLYTYDSFMQYAAHFSSLFGLRSEKALSLFSHIVGVKVLGNLNEFIRSNMLEAPEMEQEFDKLHNNYQKLLTAHQKIELAEKQLELLEPVMKCMKIYNNLLAQKEETEQLYHALPGFFARCICRRLAFDLELKQEELQKLEARKTGLDKQRERIERERRAVQAALDSNDTAQQIKNIEHEIQLSRERKELKRTRCSRYQELAALLKFRKVEQEEDFRKNLQAAREEQQKIVTALDKTDNELFTLHNTLDKASDEFNRLEQEINSLRSRKSNIPLKNIQVREELAAMLETAPEKLPFAGELIKVKEEELDWEPAAERLLHNFALCLLIDGKFYKKVNLYVNSHDLRNRLVYFKVDTDLQLGYQQKISDLSLVYKLRVKSDSPFKSWVEDYIHDHFDFACLDNAEHFSRYNKAVTRSGLIKNDNRHEKDDRPGRQGRDTYVLGWDNRSKLSFLMHEAGRIKQEITGLEKQRLAFKRRRDELETVKTDLTRFQEINQFQDINWWEDEKRIGDLAGEIEALMASSFELQELKQKLNTLERQLEEANRDYAKINQEMGSLFTEIKLLQNTVTEYEKIQQLYNHIDLEQYTGKLQAYIVQPLGDLAFPQLKKQQEASLQQLSRELAEVTQKLAEEEKKLARAMNHFTNPGIDILRVYPSWNNITTSLHPEVEYRADYEKVYNEIKRDDLPKYKKEFKQFLNEKMIEDMVNFNESLIEGEREIRNSIDELNNALRTIEYNKTPATYIILNSEENKDTVIREFRLELKNILGDAYKTALQDEAELEHTFKKMQKLILELKGDDNKRKKVLDVRNWCRFSAVEQYKEDHSQKQFYEDSQSLSGGEKAKLAYTILASAIAYQFGIQGSSNPDKSFRFAIVDEAFSKVDPENSIYAMELFRKMELQLMVVTPLDRINLTEDYIHAVHFVENNRGNSANLYNLTMEEYREKKAAYFRDKEQDNTPVAEKSVIL